MARSREIAMVMILVIYLLQSKINAQKTCTTKENKIGTCIPIKDCKKLFETDQRINSSPKQIEQLENFECDEESDKEKQPKICCESPAPVGSFSVNQCVAPNQKKGICVGIYKCPQLYKLLELRRPLNYSELFSDDIINYLRESSCPGPEQYSVCCTDQTPFYIPVTPAEFNTDISKLLPSKRQCLGVYTGDRILGGNLAGLSQFPSMVLIEYKGLKNDTTYLSCAGSLISKRYVLTAAHCVKGFILYAIGTPINIRLGVYDKSKPGPSCVPLSKQENECNDEPITVPIQKIIPHPGFIDIARSKNDIALIRMEKEVEFTEFIKPVCLPESDMTEKLNKQNLTTAGWGLTEKNETSDKLLYAKIPFVNQTACSNQKNHQYLKTELWHKQLCSGGKKGIDSCRGDSGGPLFNRVDRRMELIGIVSFGATPCGLDGIPGVYTKVYSYLDWIHGNIEP